VLPQVFHSMPGGQIFGTLFFLLLFIGAITSAISMLQPSVAFLEEFWNLRRIQGVSLVAFLVTVGTLMVGWFTEGLMALDVMDFWFGTMFLYLTSCLFFTLFNYVWGTKNGIAELQTGAAINLPRGLGFVIRWITPGILLIIFASWLYQNIFIQQSSQVTNLLNCEPGALFPIVWTIMVAAFFAVVIYTSHNFKKDSDNFNN
jgi:SNF family Na+-dependent transporter